MGQAGDDFLDEEDVRLEGGDFGHGVLQVLVLLHHQRLKRHDFIFFWFKKGLACFGHLPTTVVLISSLTYTWDHVEAVNRYC